MQYTCVSNTYLKTLYKSQTCVDGCYISNLHNGLWRQSFWRILDLWQGKAPLKGDIVQDTACHNYFAHLFGCIEEGATSVVKAQPPRLQHTVGSLYNGARDGVGFVIGNFPWCLWISQGCHQPLGQSVAPVPYRYKKVSLYRQNI